MSSFLWGSFNVPNGDIFWRLQVERNLASGAKNLFMPHELVAEQVMLQLQLITPDVEAPLW